MKKFCQKYDIAALLIDTVVGAETSLRETIHTLSQALYSTLNCLQQSYTSSFDAKAWISQAVLLHHCWTDQKLLKHTGVAHAKQMRHFPLLFPPTASGIDLSHRHWCSSEQEEQGAANENYINNLIGLLRAVICAVMTKQYLTTTGTSSSPCTALSHILYTV